MYLSSISTCTSKDLLLQFDDPKFNLPNDRRSCDERVKEKNRFSWSVLAYQQKVWFQPFKRSPKRLQSVVNVVQTFRASRRLKQQVTFYYCTVTGLEPTSGINRIIEQISKLWTIDLVGSVKWSNSNSFNKAALYTVIRRLYTVLRINLWVLSLNS